VHHALMGLFSWILFGLLAGAVARLLVPRSGGIGCLGTIALGVLGAVVGGLVGEVLLDDEVRFGWDLEPFLLSVLGAVALLLVLRIRRRY
jgi:uncharacterized membrane protein YeaQ/YmgE (transglycosylase-associated protein family)